MTSAVDNPAPLSPPARRAIRALLLFLCLGLILFLAWLEFDQFRSDRLIRQRVAQSSAAEAQLLRVLSLQQDVETGQRGYVLTGDRTFLQPYLAARGATRQGLADLRRTFAQDPAADRSLSELERLAEGKLTFAARVVALGDRGDSAAAARLVATGEGKAIMDRMRAVVDELIEAERQDLAKLNDQATRSRTRSQLLSLGIQFLLLGLLTWAFVAYVAKISRLRSLSALAQDSSTRFAAIFAAANDAMLVLDDEGRINLANPAAERLFALTQEQLHGLPVSDLFAREPRAGTLRALLRRAARGGIRRGRGVQEFVGKRSDGSTFEGEVATSPVQLADRLCFLVVIRDASERRRVDRLKAEFVATVSHELRTPLTSIAGSLGLVAAGATGPLEPRTAKLINIALSNSQRLVRLINDILDIEKIESGKMVFNIRRLPLRAAVEEAVQANLGFAAQNGVEVSLDPGGEDTLVRADQDRLAQVLTNLLSNAIKFSPKGTTVRVAIVPGDTRHAITIADSGPGIPPEFQGSLFTRFAQADGSSSRSKGGTGLGLAIVKEILDRTGGAISYDTSPAGTCFRVELPAQADQRKRGVLLVQVAETVATQIEEALTARGMRVERVRDAEEIAAAAGRRSYDAVLLGLSREGGSAAALVRSIRSNPALAETPILAAAPGSEPGQVSHAVELVDWLSEPPTSVTVARGTHLGLAFDGSGGCRRVLHVEDDEDVLRVVASAFEGKAAVVAARNAAEAREALARETPDLVILDLSLSGESGLNLLPSLRRPSGDPIPVVIYTASDEDAEISSRAVAMLTKSKASLDDLVATVLRIVGDGEPSGG